MSGLAVALAATPAHAGGATLGTDPRGLAPLGLRVALSSDGARSTRWQMAVLPPGEPVAWLVPARPGAVLDLAGEPFFAALNDATRVRVARPPSAGTANAAGALCGPDGDLEVVRDEVPQERATPSAAQPTLLTTEAELARFATERGFALPAGLAGRAFRDGFALIALTFDAGARPSSTPVVRVTDEGAPTLPLLLTRALGSPIPVTAWVLGESPAQLGAAVDLPAAEIVWSPLGSNYLAARERAVAKYRGFGFLTEGASHELVFGGFAPSAAQPALVETFAARVARTTPEAAACADALGRLRNAPVRFGRVCGAGALGRVPGPGDACAPAAGDADVTLATCGTTDDDLALAFSGKRVDRLSLTRAYGLIPTGTYGALVGIEPGAERATTVTSGAFDPSCGTATSPAAPRPPATSPTAAPTQRGSGTSRDDGAEQTYEGSGCSGGGAVAVDTSSDTDTSDSCGGGSSSSSDDAASSDSGCGGDTVGGDNDGAGDACASDSSSSSGDSCGGGSSGDDCSGADAAPKRSGRSGKSPVSRAALALFALALPLRRLLRKRV